MSRRLLLQVLLLLVGFAKLKSRIQRPCFTEFNPSFMKDVITFPNGLRLHSLHSQNESWEGMNVLAWVMDEASAFRTSSGGDNAEQVYNTLRTSANSRFPWAHWMGFIISFPRKQQGDFTLTKYTQSEDPDSSMFGDRAATWEVNPMFEEGHPMYREFEWSFVEELNVRVPQPYAEDFKHDGVDAQTKFMCNPPPTEGGFFEFPAAITESINKELPPLVVTANERTEIHDDGKKRVYTVRDVDSYPPKQPDVPYYMHGDPGLSNDAFALSVAHVMPESKLVTMQDGNEVLLNKVVVDFVLAWEPRQQRPVDLLNVEKVIQQTADYYDVRQVTFDRWNSAHSIQSLIANGIWAEDLAFTSSEQFKMFRLLKLLIYNDLLELPDDDQLQNELKYLKNKNGKIEHDIYGKDRADAVAAVVWNALGRQTSKVKTLVQSTIDGGKRRGGSEAGAGAGAHCAALWSPALRPYRAGGNLCSGHLASRSVAMTHN